MLYKELQSRDRGARWVLIHEVIFILTFLKYAMIVMLPFWGLLYKNSNHDITFSFYYQKKVISHKKNKSNQSI